MRTATISINVPKERYWPNGWERPAEYPTFQAVEIGDNRLGMEVRQDGAWVRLPSQAALHIRVMTVQTADLRDRVALLEDALGHVIDHWWEFGEMMMANAYTYGFDEKIDAAAKLVK